MNDASKTPGLGFFSFTATCFGPVKYPDGMFCLLHYYLPEFEGFTDYRCFHVCKKAVTFEGVTKEVGVVECKPDAASPTWGDTSGVPGKAVLLALVVRDFFLKGVF